MLKFIKKTAQKPGLAPGTLVHVGERKVEKIRIRAIEFDEESGHSHVISALCKACGVCVAACPSSAIKGRHFTDEQLLAQIDGLFNNVKYEIEETV